MTAIVDMLAEVVAFFAACLTPILILGPFVAFRSPHWIADWVNRRNHDSPRFRLRYHPYYSELRLPSVAIEIDPRKAVSSERILTQVRQICSSTALVALAYSATLFTGWLMLGNAGMLLSACVLAGLLVWEIFPVRSGIRYWTGVRNSKSLVRTLCLGALHKALDDEVPWREWHPSYFEILSRPVETSEADFRAASWLYTYAMLNGDLATAARHIELSLVGIPDSATDQYVGLGDALHFYAAVLPDERRCSVLERIRSIQWDLPSHAEYIEASIALVEGRRDDALSIANTMLERIGMEGGTARTQLNRYLLLACRNRALSS